MASVRVSPPCCSFQQFSAFDLAVQGRRQVLEFFLWGGGGGFSGGKSERGIPSR